MSWGPARSAWGKVAVRSGPDRRNAAVMTTFSQFRPDFHPRMVLALDERRGATGVADLVPRSPFPGRPNGRTRLDPGGGGELEPVDRWLVVYRGSRKFELYVGGRTRGAPGPWRSARRGMETPIGLFYVQSRFVPSRYPILGAFAFETSGYSKLSDWPGGGVVGVHGTNTPWLIGQAVSHGCVRLRNSDVLALRNLVRVGTPVKIVAA